MKFQISKYTVASQQSTIFWGVLTFILILLKNLSTFFLDLSNITFAIFLFGLSIKELNTYQYKKNKLYLFLGIILCLFFMITIYTGIGKIQFYFY